MKKYIVENREYSISLDIEHDKINITCMDYDTCKKYECEIDGRIHSKYIMIDNVNTLYMFLMDCFETGKNNFQIVDRSNEIILLATIDAKYKSESYKFVLNEIKIEMRDRIEIRLDILNKSVKKIDELSKDVINLRDQINQMMAFSYYIYPNGKIMMKNFDQIIIEWVNEKINIISHKGSEEREYNYITENAKEIGFMLKQTTPMQQNRWHVVHMKNMPLNNLNGIFDGEKIKINVLVLENIINLSDFKFLESFKIGFLVIIGKINSTINWQIIIQMSNINHIVIDAPINGLVIPQCGNGEYNNKLGPMRQKEGYDEVRSKLNKDDPKYIIK